MEVKKSEVAALCNSEVLHLLNELKREATHQKTGNHLATIIYEASQYLHGLCGEATDMDVTGLLKALLEFPVPLSHNEKLMLVNTPPRTQLQLTLIVHNCDERLTEEQIELLLNIIKDNMP